MSISSTLTLLQQAIQIALGPSIPVYVYLQTVPYDGDYPYVVITEYKQVVTKQFSGLRGNITGVPNLYSFAYVQQNLTSESNTQTMPQAIDQLRTNVELIVAAFSKRSNQALGQHVVQAGEYIQIDYDRHGPYINYLGDNHIGCFGMISVFEEYRADID